MTILITGGCKCGKSSIAEEFFSDFDGKKFYIATMEPFGDEAQKAISRHRKMRMGKGFETVEKYTDIQELRLPRRCGILLECACNLMANEMFSRNEKNPAEKITAGIKKLSEQAELLVIVTNQVGADGMEYSPETTEYIRQLGLLNIAVAKYADTVIEAVCGIPVLLKGAVK